MSKTKVPAKISDDEILLNPAKVSFIIAQKRPSFRELANTYNVSKSKLQQVAKRDGWETQRARYHRNIMDTANKKVMNKIAQERRDKLEKINKVFHHGIDKLLNLIDKDKYVVSVRDINLLVRLTEFMDGNPEQIKEKRFVLDKPLQEYTVEELIALRNMIHEGTAEVAEYEIIGEEDD